MMEMDKVLLLNLPRASSGEYMRREEYCFGVTDFIQLPMYLANISGLLKGKGVKVEFIDANRDKISYSDLGISLREDKPDTVVCAITISHAHEESEIARICNNIGINCVGIAVPRGYAEDFATKYEFYFTVYAEPESVIGDFVNGVNREDLKGIVYKRGGETVKSQRPTLSFKDLPAPDWDLIDPAKYERIQYLLARGCPYHCTFCTWGQESWQLKPVDKVLDDLDVFEDRGKRIVWLDGAQVTTNKKWVNQFCAEKKGRGNKILFTASIRADEEDISTLYRLKEAGCYGVFAGVETVNQELLDRIEKKITVEQYRKMITDCKEAGLPLTIFFLFGLGETDEDVDNYIKFVRETDPPWLAAGLVNVYKGTRLYDLGYSYDIEEANERYRMFYTKYLSLKEHELMELRWLYETNELKDEEYKKKNRGLLQSITDIREHLRRRGGQISVSF